MIKMDKLLIYELSTDIQKSVCERDTLKLSACARER